jgi:hypothetical protein
MLSTGMASVCCHALTSAKLMWLIQKSPRPLLYVGAGVHEGQKHFVSRHEGSYRDIDLGVATMNNYKLQITSYCDAHPSQRYLASVVTRYSSFPLKRENSR